MGRSVVWVAQNQETAEPRRPLTGIASCFRYESDEWFIKKRRLLVAAGVNVSSVNEAESELPSDTEIPHGFRLIFQWIRVIPPDQAQWAHRRQPAKLYAGTDGNISVLPVCIGGD